MRYTIHKGKASHQGGATLFFKKSAWREEAI
jgi:hypothetical protein